MLLCCCSHIQKNPVKEFSALPSGFDGCFMFLIDLLESLLSGWNSFVILHFGLVYDTLTDFYGFILYPLLLNISHISSLVISPRFSFSSSSFISGVGSRPSIFISPISYTVLFVSIDVIHAFPLPCFLLQAYHIFPISSTVKY